jgi:hypothetical protein
MDEVRARFAAVVGKSFVLSRQESRWLALGDEFVAFAADDERAGGGFARNRGCSSAGALPVCRCRAWSAKTRRSRCKCASACTRGAASVAEASAVGIAPSWRRASGSPRYALLTPPSLRGAHARRPPRDRLETARHAHVREAIGHLLFHGPGTERHESIVRWVPAALHTFAP